MILAEKIIFFFEDKGGYQKMIFSPSLTQECSEKKNKELQLLQVGVETESLLLVQMMCCEDSVHVTRTLLSVHIFWRLRSLCARAVGL